MRGDYLQGGLYTEVIHVGVARRDLLYAQGNGEGEGTIRAVIKFLISRNLCMYNCNNL